MLVMHVFNFHGLDPPGLFRFTLNFETILQTFGRIPWKGDRLFVRSVPTQNKKIEKVVTCPSL